MTLPTLSIELDLLNAADGWVLGDATKSILGVTTKLAGPTTPTWQADLTPYVRAWSSNRGTQRELQQVQAGEASVTLDNRSGRFTPLSTTSVYYPNLVPMRRIRIRATWNSITYPIFQGFVEAWPVSFPEVGMDQIVTLQAVDAFAVLAKVAVSGSFPQQLSSVRVGAILDAVGWPAADRDIEGGSVDVQAQTLTNDIALEAIQEIEQAEAGRFFISRDGKATFRRRGSLPGASFGGRTWSDVPGEGMSYRDIVPSFGSELIFNDIRLSRSGGLEQVAQSGTSKQKYGGQWSSLVATNLLLTSDADVATLASDLLNRYAEPKLRIDSLTDNAMGHKLWNQLLARELRDRVLVNKTPTGASTISQDLFIEGIAHSWQVDTWTTTLSFSPTVESASGWVLGDPELSILGVTTSL